MFHHTSPVALSVSVIPSIEIQSSESINTKNLSILHAVVAIHKSSNQDVSLAVVTIALKEAGSEDSTCLPPNVLQ